LKPAPLASLPPSTAGKITAFARAVHSALYQLVNFFSHLIDLNRATCGRLAEVAGGAVEERRQTLSFGPDSTAPQARRNVPEEG